MNINTIKIVSLSLIYLIICLSIGDIDSKPDDFCKKYNCDCSTDNKTSEFNVNCRARLSNKLNEIEITEPSLHVLDLSINNLEMFVFSDTNMNTKRLYLNMNLIKMIPSKMFAKMQHLVELDIGCNRIGKMSEDWFPETNSLERLNMSMSFSSSFSISREICELVNLKVLDLSYADLKDFTLECWKTQPNIQIEEIYLRNAQNVESSLQNWFPYIGSKLKLIDLTNTSIVNLDANTLSKGFSNLKTLILSDNPKLDKETLIVLLQKNRLIEQLTTLYISNINASNNTLPLLDLFTHTNYTNLIDLDISYNSYDEDLNLFIFNQNRLSKLIRLKANNNKFSQCNRILVAGRESTLFQQLEYLNLANNRLKDSSCLFPLRAISSLKYLDLSHNQLKIESYELKDNDFLSFLSNKPNLTYIDLSFNKLTILEFYFCKEQQPIKKFDVSHNLLKTFRFLSWTTVNSAKFPTNVKVNSKRSVHNLKTTISNSNDNDEEEEEYDYDESEYYDDDSDSSSSGGGSYVHSDTLAENHSEFAYDDDIRFVYIDDLLLNNNEFHTVNLLHMLQSVRNVINLDMSHNPLQLIGGMTGEASIIKNKLGGSADEVNKDLEALCIDYLDLNNCKLRRLPSFQHTCINRANLTKNLLSGGVHLYISNYSLYFMDNLDLRKNNITYLSFIISDQRFKQDGYLFQNSPFHFFYHSAQLSNGETVTKMNGSVVQHTVIDLKDNKHFRCDYCHMFSFLNDPSFKYVKIESDTDCSIINNAQLAARCKQLSGSSKVSIKSLNNKLRVLFLLTCILLIVLSVLMVYHLVKNSRLYDHCRLFTQRVSNIFSSGYKSVYDGNSMGVMGGSGSSSNPSATYRRLKDENTSSSQIEFNT